MLFETLAYHAEEYFKGHDVKLDFGDYGQHAMGCVRFILTAYKDLPCPGSPAFLGVLLEELLRFYTGNSRKNTIFVSKQTPETYGKDY